MPQVRQGSPVKARNGQMVRPPAQSSKAVSKMKTAGRQIGCQREMEMKGEDMRVTREKAVPGLTTAGTAQSAPSAPGKLLWTAKALCQGSRL